jgi:hypothetical protein
MRALRIAAAFALIVCWIPATSYCAMERAGLVQCPGCCSDSDNDSSCDDCVIGCSSDTAVPNGATSILKLFSVPLAAVSVTCGNGVEQFNIALGRVALSPPHLVRLAEFLGRTATRPRAPAAIA